MNLISLFLLSTFPVIPEPTSPDSSTSFIFTIEEPRRDRDPSPPPPPIPARTTTTTRGRGRGGKRVLAGRTSSIAFDGIPDGGDTPVQMRNREMRKRMDSRADDDEEEDQDQDEIGMDIDQDESIRIGNSSRLNADSSMNRFNNNTPVTRDNTLRNRNIPSSSSSSATIGKGKKPNQEIDQDLGVSNDFNPAREQVATTSQSKLGKGLPLKKRGGNKLDSSDPSSSSTKLNNNRRPSTVLKQSRRTSQLRSGAIAYPHSNVPDFELYRHLADNIPDVQRMRFLASWSLQRGLEKALTPPSVANPIHAPKALKGSRDKAKKEEATGKKRKKDGDEGEDGIEDEELKKLLGTEEVHWNENDRANLVRYREVAEEIMRNTMRDLTEGRISIGWMKQIDHVSL